MSYDASEKDCVKEARFTGCPRHPFNELPCVDCIDEAKARRTHEAAQSTRANHFKRQPRPVQRQMPRLMRGR